MSRLSDKWRECKVRAFFRTKKGSGCAVVVLAYALVATVLLWLRGCGG